MRAPHLVPLSRQALAILDELKPISGGYDLVFPGRNDRAQADQRKHAALRALSHGVSSPRDDPRISCARLDDLNECGLWRPDAIERQLAHKEQNAVRAAYHRSEYMEERARMMQWWADYLDTEEARGFRAG